jgi:hypothetical protein
MEDRKEPDVRAQMVRIAGHGQEGLGNSLKEESIEHPRVLERQWTQGMREGKHHMDGGHVEQLSFAGREPSGLRPTWTLGAMPIATGVLRDLKVTALVTLRRVPAKSCGPADSDRAEGAVLLRGQGGAIPRTIGGAVLAHDISDFEWRAVHRGSSRGKASRGLGVVRRACGVTWR